MEVPFYRKYSLEPEQQKILKTAVLASIEHMKTLGGFYWYDDKELQETPNLLTPQKISRVSVSSTR